MSDATVPLGAGAARLAGLGILLRMQLRRDWWQVLLWAGGITLLYVGQAVSVEGLYTSQAEFDRAAASMDDDAAFVAMAGPARALDTIGGQVFWQAAAFGAVLVGLMSMLLVVRHTRAEEESGRDELLRSAPVGRWAGLAAALATAGLANLVVGLAVAGSLAAYPLALQDSVVTGLGLTLSGWVFAGVAVLAAQVVSSPRTAYALTGATIAIAYVARAIGDVGAPALSWLSPIGWYQATHAFSGVRWWPLLLPVLAVLVTLGLAAAALGHRDHGAGLLATRPGPAHGRIGSGLALSWRLQRGSVVGWTIGLFATGLAYGSIGDDVATLIGDSQGAREVLASGGDLVDGFYAVAGALIGLLATGFTVTSALRARSEEGDGRTELLLAAGLDRRRWLEGHLVVTVVGSALVLTAGGAGLWLGFGAVTGQWVRSADLAVPVLAYLSPALVCAGLAAVLTGLLPRLTLLTWAVVAWSAVVLLFADVLRLPTALRALSPFDHLARTPAEAFAWAPVVLLLAVAAALAALARFTLSRRDIG